MKMYLEIPSAKLGHNFGLKSGRVDDSLRSGKGYHFADNILKWIFFGERFVILLQISLSSFFKWTNFEQVSIGSSAYHGLTPSIRQALIERMSYNVHYAIRYCSSTMNWISSPGKLTVFSKCSIAFLGYYLWQDSNFVVHCPLISLFVISQEMFDISITILNILERFGKKYRIMYGLAWITIVIISDVIRHSFSTMTKSRVRICLQTNCAAISASSWKFWKHDSCTIFDYAKQKQNDCSLDLTSLFHHTRGFMLPTDTGKCPQAVSLVLMQNGQMPKHPLQFRYNLCSNYGYLDTSYFKIETCICVAFLLQVQLLIVW